jgi:kumamolisin
MEKPGREMRALEGSDRRPLSHAREAGAVDAGETVGVTVYVRAKAPPTGLPSAEELGETPPQLRRYLSTAELDALISADPADMEQVATFARQAGLDVVSVDPRTRAVRLQGPASAMESAFGTKLTYFDHPVARYRGRSGPVQVPSELGGIVEAVFGLDNRVVGRPYRRPGPIVGRALRQPSAFFPPQVAQLYNYPTHVTAAGQCIGILAFNGRLAETGIIATGGYDRAALETYFRAVLRMDIPDIVDVVVHGPGNKPDPQIPSDTSGEVMLDIQVAGSCAPGAKLVVYFTEFTEQGWVDAIIAAVHDTQNNPSVLSISYGNAEDAGERSLWTGAAVAKVDEAFRLAAYRGLTICCASGDQGSSDLLPDLADGRAHVDFPASSPFVLACGGTRVESVGGQILRETAWNDGPSSATGGGVSRLFPTPRYQYYVPLPVSANPDRRSGRVVPDVAGLADPETGVLVMSVTGQPENGPVGGTSVTAPLWSALIALLNSALGVPVGYLNPLLYRYFAHGVLRDITIGDNGAYRCGLGYDAVTGLGAPDGARLLAALQSLAMGLPRPPPSAPPMAATPRMEAPPDDRFAQMEAMLASLAQRQEAIACLMMNVARASGMRI